VQCREPAAPRDAHRIHIHAPAPTGHPAVTKAAPAFAAGYGRARAMASESPATMPRASFFACLRRDSREGRDGSSDGLTVVAYGVLQQTPHVVPGFAELRGAAPRQIEQVVDSVQSIAELGTIAGRLLFPIPVLRIAPRRRQLRLGLIPGLVVFASAYFWPRRVACCF
jgi:hypothetical protein